MLTHWKEREGAYRVRRARIVREAGAVPAYATTAGGAPEDVEPGDRKRRTRRGSLIAPEEPGAPISRDEFQELVADLDVDSGAAAGKPTGGGRRSAVAQREDTEAPPAPPKRDPTADLTPEDLVLKENPKPRQKNRRPRNKRHGRAR